jgi:hypothetical protein
MRTVQFDGKKDTQMTFGNLEDSNELIGITISAQSSKRGMGGFKRGGGKSSGSQNLMTQFGLKQYSS